MEGSSRVAVPRQARSRESLERVMRAGLQLLSEDGWEGFTMAAACRRAGVSMGMLYRRFANRDAFLAAVQDRWITDLEEAQQAFVARPVAWEELSFEDAVGVAVNGVVNSIAADERLLRTWATHDALDNDGLGRLAGIARRNAAWFVAGLMHHRSAIAHPRAERAAEFGFRLVLDMSVRRANYGDDFATGTSVGDWPVFATELRSVVIAYLQRSPIPA